MAAITLVCPACSSINRVPAERLAQVPICGACHKPLFTAHPLSVNENALARHIQNDGIDLLVDIWAPWCGPCNSMAPHFEQAAAQLEPRMRLLKLNADTAPASMTKYAVRSIPTLLLFSGGALKSQKVGAMTAQQILQWVRCQTTT
ncbi:MAG: thiol reductase thioredoxin [Acidocella sp. 20-61-6]|nr:MAG: thiol reductase thioredoxin [Acidocella sp. 20-61-6]